LVALRKDQASVVEPGISELTFGWYSFANLSALTPEMLADENEVPHWSLRTQGTSENTSGLWDTEHHWNGVVEFPLAEVILPEGMTPWSWRR